MGRGLFANIKTLQTTRQAVAPQIAFVHVGGHMGKMLAPPSLADLMLN